jgi:phage gpG-like protein
MLDPAQLKKDIISDMRVELHDEFDRNFTRKAFFTNKWKKRRDPNALGSLLVVTGSLRRSIQATETATGVRFTSNQPYATLHNEGGKGTVTVRQHYRKSKKGNTYAVRQHLRTVNMPQRQFVGDGPETQRIIQGVIDDNVNRYNQELIKALRK